MLGECGERAFTEPNFIMDSKAKDFIWNYPFMARAYTEAGFIVVSDSDGCPQREGVFPVVGECSKFVKCHLSVPEWMECKVGEVFDIEWR